MNFQTIEVTERDRDRQSPVTIVSLEPFVEYLDDLSDYDDGEYLITAEEWENNNNSVNN